jgi:hypothetical protein
MYAKKYSAMLGSPRGLDDATHAFSHVGDRERIYGTLKIEGVEDTFTGIVREYGVSFSVERQLPENGSLTLEYVGKIGDLSMKGTMHYALSEEPRRQWIAVPKSLEDVDVDSLHRERTHKKKGKPRRRVARSAR